MNRSTFVHAAILATAASTLSAPATAAAGGVTRARDQIIRSRPRQELAGTTPLRMDFTVVEIGDGLYDYRFTLTIDNHDESWEPGQSWGWVVFADAQSADSPLPDFVGDPDDLPIGPWDTYTTSMGYHNGPTLWYVLDEWEPAAEGESLSWSGTSSYYTEELIFSTLVGSGALANFEPMSFLGTGCDLEIDASDYVEVIAPDSPFSFRFDLVNGCAEEATFDAVTMQVSGALSLSKTLFQGARVYLGAESNVGSGAALYVPPGSSGEYEVELRVMRDGAVLDTDAFHVMVE